MDFLLEAAEELQREVFSSVAHLFNLEVDLLYFDTTSTYFEVEEKDNPEDKKQHLRRKGNSKDHRPDLPQVVIGLAVTQEGLPVRCWVWPGNTADMSVIEQVKKDLVASGWAELLPLLTAGLLQKKTSVASSEPAVTILPGRRCAVVRMLW